MKRKFLAFCALLMLAATSATHAQIKPPVNGVADSPLIRVDKKIRGDKRYELNNHLENNQVVITDRKLPDSTGSGIVLSYKADIYRASDYFAFGMQMPKREFEKGSYRYGFNGFEKDDELKGSGQHVSYGGYGFDPRIARRWTPDPFASRFPFQSPYVHADNSPIASVDSWGDSTVVVVYGEGRAVRSTANGRTNIMYDVEVYENMSQAQYDAHQANGTMPTPSYRTALARDAHDIVSKKQTVVHSDLRYGTNNETPPGTYYLTKPGTNGDKGGGSYNMYLGDTNGSRIIQGPDGQRAGIAIHQYDPNDAQGCLTTCSGRDTQPVSDLMNAIPDLDDDTQPVKIILKPREVTQTTYADNANGNIKYEGFEHTYDGGLLDEIVVTAKRIVKEPEKKAPEPETPKP